NAVRLFHRLDDHGACPVAEQHRGGAVLPIDDLGKGFAADGEDPLALARLDQAPGDPQRVDPPRTGGQQIERTRVQLEAVLNERGRGREERVWGVGRDDDHVDAGKGVVTMARDEVLDGPEGQIAAELVITGDMPSLYAGARRDPLVGRVHHPLEVLVGYDVRRRVC